MGGKETEDNVFEGVLGRVGLTVSSFLTFSVAPRRVRVLSYPESIPAAGTNKLDA